MNRSQALRELELLENYEFDRGDAPVPSSDPPRQRRHAGGDGGPESRDGLHGVARHLGARIRDGAKRHERRSARVGQRSALARHAGGRLLGLEARGKRRDRGHGTHRARDSAGSLRGDQGAPAQARRRARGARRGPPPLPGVARPCRLPSRSAPDRDALLSRSRIALEQDLGALRDGPPAGRGVRRGRDGRAPRDPPRHPVRSHPRRGRNGIGRSLAAGGRHARPREQGRPLRGDRRRGLARPPPKTSIRSSNRSRPRARTRGPATRSSWAASRSRSADARRPARTPTTGGAWTRCGTRSTG